MPNGCFQESGLSVAPCNEAGARKRPASCLQSDLVRVLSRFGAWAVGIQGGVRPSRFTSCKRRLTHFWQEDGYCITCSMKNEGLR